MPGGRLRAERPRSPSSVRGASRKSSFSTTSVTSPTPALEDRGLLEQRRLDLAVAVARGEVAASRSSRTRRARREQVARAARGAEGGHRRKSSDGLLGTRRRGQVACGLAAVARKAHDRRSTTIARAADVAGDTGQPELADRPNARTISAWRETALELDRRRAVVDDAWRPVSRSIEAHPASRPVGRRDDPAGRLVRAGVDRSLPHRRAAR